MGAAFILFLIVFIVVFVDWNREYISKEFASKVSRNPNRYLVP